MNGQAPHPREPIIRVSPEWAKKLFPHFTEQCAIECVRELMRLTYLKGRVTNGGANG